MIHKDFLCHLTFTFRVSLLQGGVCGFYGAWLRAVDAVDELRGDLNNGKKAVAYPNCAPTC
jgi:hypothetical protein